MSLSLVFLGTGGSLGVPEIGCTCRVCKSENTKNKRTRSSLCIQHNGKNIVIDTTPEFRMQAISNGISRVDALLITHSHADHIMGLADIRSYNFRQGRPIDTYARVETLAQIKTTFEYIFSAPPELKQYYPQVNLILLNSSFDLFGLHVQPLTVYHGRMPVTAFRFGKVAYITDVNRIPEEEYLKLTGLELLIIEAFRLKRHISHFSLSEAIQVAQRINAQRTLFTHISHDFDHNTVNAQLPPSMSLAYDGMNITVPE